MESGLFFSVEGGVWRVELKVRFAPYHNCAQHSINS